MLISETPAHTARSATALVELLTLVKGPGEDAHIPREAEVVQVPIDHFRAAHASQTHVLQKGILCGARSSAAHLSFGFAEAGAWVCVPAMRRNALAVGARAGAVTSAGGRKKLRVAVGEDLKTLKKCDGYTFV